MRQNPDSRIEVEYVESESGCQILQTVTAELKPAPFSLVPLILRCGSEASLRAGVFEIQLPDGLKNEDADGLLEPISDTEFKLNLPEYRLEATYISNDKGKKLHVTEENGNRMTISGFAKVVFESEMPDEIDSSSLIENPTDISVCFPAYTLGCTVLENTDFTYNVENLVELDVRSCPEDVFDDWAQDFDTEYNNAEYLREYFGAHYSDFIRYVLEENKNLTAETLAAAGF